MNDKAKKPINPEIIDSGSVPTSPTEQTVGSDSTTPELINNVPGEHVGKTAVGNSVIVSPGREPIIVSPTAAGLRNTPGAKHIPGRGYVLPDKDGNIPPIPPAEDPK